MGTYDISKINNWFNDFTSAKKRFSDKYYSDFTNSYIRNCNDSAVVNMYNKLNQHYEKIKRINLRINNIWDDFLFDVQAIDNRLAGQHVNARDSLISSKLSKIQNLEEYESDLNTKISSLSAKVGIVDKIGWSEDKTFSENLGVLESTAAVITTSVISGVWKLSENIIDGALWLGTVVITSYCSMYGFDELASNVQNKMMDVIGFDVMGKANELFYENTNIGKKINENSLIKYDSDVAQSIQNASTKATEIAVATGLTVATGGMAAPLSALIVAGTGFAIGAGAKAEENFSKEDRDFYGDFIEIGFAGGIKAVEFYSEGQMVSGAFKTIGSIKSAGGVKSFLSFMKTAFSSGKSGMSAKGLLKGGIKATLKDVDTYMDSIGAAFNNITYDNEKGIKINWKGLIKETASNFALNCVFGFIGNTLESGLKNLEIKSDYSNELYNGKKTNKTLKTEMEINDNLIGDKKNYYMKDLNISARQKFLDSNDGTSSFDYCAKRLGINNEELLTAFDKKTKEIVDNSVFGIRIDDENLYKALKGGQFKNQFETGTTKGVADLNGRTNCEKSLFGVPDNASLSDRPVYGMLFPELDKSNQMTLDYFKDRYNGRSYGDTVVILNKDNVINNTTMTFGDSLTYKVQPTEAANPKFNGGFNGIYSHINSMDDLKNATIRDLSDGINAYPEIQLHGADSHRIENIEKVIFMNSPDKKLLKMLKKFNIPFEII